MSKPMSRQEKHRQYELRKAQQRKKFIEITRESQDIAPMPAVKHPVERGLADDDFRFFCERYFSQQFYLAWSDDHLRVIEKIERVVVNHETIAIAMPRGSGKTTLCEAAVIWAILTGRHQFVFLISSTQQDALSLLTNIKHHLEHNDLLLDDYPEAIHPIRSMDGESRKCLGQRFYGRRTSIGWSAEELVIASIPGSRCSGSVVRVSGITGHIRGAKFVRSDGSSVRPSLVIIDDPQTDDSARSLTQTANRLSILKGAISGLAGPGKRVAQIMPCTVIQPGDLVDQILDREKNPLWYGERTKMLRRFPTNMKLWERYAEIRAQDIAANGDGSKATEFYAANRAEMDAGAEISWPARFRKTELSAIQNAMNVKFEVGDRAFFSEYQNDPLPIDEMLDEGLLTADQIASKLNGLERRIVPLEASYLTAFIDVQAKLLYWVICAWSEEFTGTVIDYGTYPEQARGYFSLRDVRTSLKTKAPGTGLEGSIYAGLDALTKFRLGMEYVRHDGARMKILLCMIDANWGESTDVVYQFCRQSQFAAQLIPSHGRFVGASSKPMDEYHPEPGCRAGLNWRMPLVRGKRAIRHVTFDTNFWKSFLHARLAVAIGDSGSLSIYGRDPNAHRMFADHLVSEYRVKTFGRGRVVDEWRMRPNLENHFLDCAVGCCVGASILGANLKIGAGKTTKAGPSRQKVYSAEELQKAYGRDKRIS